jgi:hypothetical protein
VTEQELVLDCVRRLNRAGLAYFLTGSMASNYWGIPRTTHDLDFVVQLGGDSIPLLISEFKADYYVDEAAIRSAFQPPYQFNAIDTRSALKVDFWLLRAGCRSISLANQPGSQPRRTSSCTNSTGTGSRHPIDN